MLRFGGFACAAIDSNAVQVSVTPCVSSAENHDTDDEVCSFICSTSLANYPMRGGGDQST